MGGKTKTVGGGAATGVANDFNAFLKQGLNNGQFGAMGQTQGIGADINSLLQGRTGDPTGLNDYQNTLKQMGEAGRYTPDAINGPTSANPYDDPNNGFNQVFGQMGGLQMGPANLQGFGAQSGDLAGIMSRIGQQANLSNMGGQQNLLNQVGMQGLMQSINPAFQRNAGNPNTPYGLAMQQLLGQQSQRDIGDLRARYAMSGGSQGSPAMQAESLYRSQAIPQMTAAMGQINQQEQGLDLQAAGLNSQNMLGQQSNALQALLGSGNLGIQSRGQDLQNWLGNREADNTAGGLSVQNANQMNQANTTARGQDLQNMLQSRSLDLQQLMQMGNMAGQSNQAGLQNNQFNSNMGFNSQVQNAQNGLNANSQYNNLLGMQGNLALQGGQLNLANANSNTQNMQNAMDMMMRMYGQANQLGTPQAQVVQTPGLFQQIGQAASGLSGLGNMFGNIFGGGGQGNFNPQMGGLPGIQQTPNMGYPGIVNPGPISSVPTGGFNPNGGYYAGMTNPYQLR
jgi:hypothetical protein